MDAPTRDQLPQRAREHLAAGRSRLICNPYAAVAGDRPAGRWRDLAVATWSVTWNFGPGYEDLFLDSYGVTCDHRRRDLYRLLYDLES